MSYFGVVDYRDEFYLKTFRRWYVIKKLVQNIKFREGVPLEKAALVDFLICNPPILQHVLVQFGKAEPSLNLEELLYQNNLEFGQAQDVDDFSKTCLLLTRGGYISFKKVDGEIFLLTESEEIYLDMALPKRWAKEISSLQPILSKSKNVLIAAIHGNQYGN
jgi:hypothetical protein